MPVKFKVCSFECIGVCQGSAFAHRQTHTHTHTSKNLVLCDPYGSSIYLRDDTSIAKVATYPGISYSSKTRETAQSRVATMPYRQAYSSYTRPTRHQCTQQPCDTETINLLQVRVREQQSPGRPIISYCWTWTRERVSNGYERCSYSCCCS